MSNILSKEDYLMLAIGDAELFGGQLAAFLKRNGEANWTVCPVCGVDDFTHSSGCSLYGEMNKSDTTMAAIFSQDRNVIEVIDQLQEAAKDDPELQALRIRLSAIREDAAYRTEETQPESWTELAWVINQEIPPQSTSADWRPSIQALVRIMGNVQPSASNKETP